MSHLGTSHAVLPKPALVSGATRMVAAVLAVWLALVVLLGTGGVFVRPPGAPPLPIFIAVTVPVIAFLVLFSLSRGFRELVMGLDPVLMTAVQAWRFAGFGFLALFVYGVLPGRFAWPAGLGDIAIGLSAPWVALTLMRRPGFAASRFFVTWNLLGILDLVVAVAMGALSALLSTGAPGEITASPMAEMPLVLIPGYLVPLFIMLHLAALFQARRLAA